MSPELQAEWAGTESSPVDPMVTFSGTLARLLYSLNNDKNRLGLLCRASLILS